MAHLQTYDQATLASMFDVSQISRLSSPLELCWEVFYSSKEARVPELILHLHQGLSKKKLIFQAPHLVQAQQVVSGRVEM